MSFTSTPYLQLRVYHSYRQICIDEAGSCGQRRTGRGHAERSSTAANRSIWETLALLMPNSVR